jgi:hypothetical protein
VLLLLAAGGWRLGTEQQAVAVAAKPMAMANLNNNTQCRINSQLAS